MRKIGMVIACPPEMELADYCKMLKDIGFESCFVADDSNACAAALDAGLEIDNMHLPYDGPVMLEVSKCPGQVTGFDGYDFLTLREYYEKAYEAAKKIRDSL